MDKENRRNSILKQVVNQQTVFEYEEEQTDTFTSSRRKSFKKRVSFAGRDEIKEFQKHEVLTIEKLEKALNKLEDETMPSNASGWDCEKENMLQQTDKKIEIINQCDDMEITNIITFEVNQSDSIVQDIEMEVTTCFAPIHDGTVFEVGCATRETKSTTCSRIVVIEDNFTCVKKNSIETSIQEMEMSTIQEDACSVSKVEKFVPIMKVPTEYKLIVEHSNLHDLIPVSEVKTDEVIKLKSDSTWKKFSLQKEPFDVMKESVEVNYPDFISEVSSEFILLATKLNWKIELFESLLVISKVKNYLVLKFKLDREYNDQKVKHYTVEDIDIYTRKDVEAKWTRLGLMILENSLENSNLMEVCKSTQHLPKLLNIVEEFARLFLDFATEDSLKFELLANPRSIKFDTDNAKFDLTFDLCNLENLFWVRIFLNLTHTFPLSAKDIRIESILGNVNKLELTNMISNIRSSSLYLTRIAECIEDFLKFRPTNSERKILNARE